MSLRYQLIFYSTHYSPENVASQNSFPVSRLEPGIIGLPGSQLKKSHDLKLVTCDVVDGSFKVIITKNTRDTVQAKNFSSLAYAIRMFISIVPTKLNFRTESKVNVS